MNGAPAAAAASFSDGVKSRSHLAFGVTLAVTIIAVILAVCFALMIAIGSLAVPGLQDVAVGKIWLLLQVVSSAESCSLPHTC